MKSVAVDVARCKNCYICVKSCPLRLITPQKGAAVVAPGCVGCGKCVEICPFGALSLRDGGGAS